MGILFRGGRYTYPVDKVRHGSISLPIGFRLIGGDTVATEQVSVCNMTGHDGKGNDHGSKSHGSCNTRYRFSPFLALEIVEFVDCDL